MEAQVTQHNRNRASGQPRLHIWDVVKDDIVIADADEPASAFNNAFWRYAEASNANLDTLHAVATPGYLLKYHEMLFAVARLFSNSALDEQMGVVQRGQQQPTLHARRGPDREISGLVDRVQALEIRARRAPPLDPSELARRFESLEVADHRQYGDLRQRVRELEYKVGRLEGELRGAIEDYDRAVREYDGRLARLERSEGRDGERHDSKTEEEDWDEEY